MMVRRGSFVYEVMHQHRCWHRISAQLWCGHPRWLSAWPSVVPTIHRIRRGGLSAVRCNPAGRWFALFARPLRRCRRWFAAEFSEPENFIGNFVIGFFALGFLDKLLLQGHQLLIDVFNGGCLQSSNDRGYIKLQLCLISCWWCLCATFFLRHR